MTISELIERLEALKAEHGDLPVFGMTGQEDWIPAEPMIGRVMYWSDEKKSMQVETGVMI